MLLLALGNKARHGKDTAGEAIVEHFIRQQAMLKRHYDIHNLKPGPVAQLFKFADALYRECRELHGMTEKDAPLLQRVGTERRAENSNYWINKVFEQIDSVKPDVAVITDLRYINEAVAVKSFIDSGFTINVSRLDSLGFPYVATDRDPRHPSETDLDSYPFDFYIKARTGDSALVAQQAITIAEYAKGLISCPI
jgi:hypothetical protein